MDHQDRETIDRYCEEFVPMINIRTLWPRLLENKIFNHDDVNIPTWKENLDDKDTIRDILLTIKTRGPKAFNNLVLSLRQTDHFLLADVLQGRATLSPMNNLPGNHSIENSSVDDDFHESLHATSDTLYIKVRRATEFRDEPDFDTLGRYRMRSRPRGYVLIITNISYNVKDKREAAEHDEASLKKLFEDMGFEVTTRMNLTGAEMKKVVREFSLRDFHLIDSCFVIISAHGAETEKNGRPETQIEGIDCGLTGAEEVLCTDIIDYFTAENSNKHLVTKPKIFIFQACRGERRQAPARVVADGIDNNVPPRNYSDILVAHSTLPGHEAYRNNKSGSWYIQILCEVFMNHAFKLHIQDLFNMVDRRLMDLRTSDSRSQTSTVKSMGFNKHCYLNPGLFEDP